MMSGILFRAFAFVVILSLGACATLEVGDMQTPPAEQVGKFSDLNQGGRLPKAWQVWRITPQKNKTEYKLEQYEGKTVLHASADMAASGLVLPLKPRDATDLFLSWQWKALDYIPNANNQDSSRDDAPLRILVAFDGDKTKLPVRDQMVFEMAKIVSGHDMPYASLLYIWAAKSPIETIITSPRTSRVKMIVVNSGPKELGVWQKHHRDLAKDYQAAFGDLPGKIIGLGLLTDTDNTRTQVNALYGDIELIK
ncbi:MAG: hypothetical protein RIQ84_842 [Pseudomonadota bacterium]|jgi:hypothetical protein